MIISEKIPVRGRSVEQKRYLGEFINSLSEGVLVLDEESTVVLRNRAAERILGMKIRARERVSVGTLFARRNQELGGFIEASCRGRRRRVAHEVTYSRGGKDVRLHVALHTRMQKGRSGGCYFVVVLNDVTGIWKLHNRERRLLSQLHKNYRDGMENLRQIAQSVAHEVRNPIVSIGGYANLLLKKCAHGEEDPGIYRKYLQYIREDVERLFRIVDQVEKYSDISEISLKKENMASLTREVLAAAASFARKRSVALRASVGRAREYTVYVDRGKIKSALRNLTRHAVILARKGSPVNVAVRFAPYEFGIDLAVSTDLPREEVPFLFNPFYSWRQQKLSFDLAAAQRIAILHGGIINTRWEPPDRLLLAFSMPKEKRLSRG